VNICSALTGRFVDKDLCSLVRCDGYPSHYLVLRIDAVLSKMYIFYDRNTFPVLGIGKMTSSHERADKEHNSST